MQDQLGLDFPWTLPSFGELHIQLYLQQCHTFNHCVQSFKSHMNPAHLLSYLMLLGIDFLENIQLQNLFFFHLQFISQTTHLLWETFSLLRLSQIKLPTLEYTRSEPGQALTTGSLPRLRELDFPNTLAISLLMSRLSTLISHPQAVRGFSEQESETCYSHALPSLTISIGQNI